MMQITEKIASMRAIHLIMKMNKIVNYLDQMLNIILCLENPIILKDLSSKIRQTKATYNIN